MLAPECIYLTLPVHLVDSFSSYIIILFLGFFIHPHRNRHLPHPTLALIRHIFAPFHIISPFNYLFCVLYCFSLSRSLFNRRCVISRKSAIFFQTFLSSYIFLYSYLFEVANFSTKNVILDPIPSPG